MSDCDWPGDDALSDAPEIERTVVAALLDFDDVPHNAPLDEHINRARAALAGLDAALL